MGSVESGRSESLGPGVVEHRIGCHVPGQVSAASETGVRGLQVSRAEIAPIFGARGWAMIYAAEAIRIAARFRIAEVVIARAGGEREDLGNKIKVSRSKERVLPVASLHIIEERLIVWTHTGDIHLRAWERGN